jgi:glycosyltransferase domain-containing protein
MTEPTVTCLVPTHNRANFLRRWFAFYVQFPPGFEVVVVDSSQPDMVLKNSALVRAHSSALRSRHLVLDLSFISKIRHALEEVETPWVCLCADDDIVLPSAVRRSAEFLSQEPRYVSAQGRSARVKPSRRWFGHNHLKGYSIEDDDPLIRCQRLAETWFTNFYAVYRTDTLLEMFRLTEAHSDCRVTYALAEMLLSQLSAIRGRIRVLPFMHLIMEVHPATTSVQRRGLVWEDFAVQYQSFRICLATQLTRAGVDPTIAGSYIDRQFVRFRDPRLSHQNPRRTVAAWMQYWGRSARERWVDWFHGVNVRHQRSIRAGDIAGTEAEWGAAVGLMRAFPDGLPAGIPADPACLPNAFKMPNTGTNPAKTADQGKP